MVAEMLDRSIERGQIKEEYQTEDRGRVREDPPWSVSLSQQEGTPTSGSLARGILGREKDW